MRKTAARFDILKIVKDYAGVALHSLPVSVNQIGATLVHLRHWVMFLPSFLCFGASGDLSLFEPRVYTDSCELSC